MYRQAIRAKKFFILRRNVRGWSSNEVQYSRFDHMSAFPRFLSCPRFPRCGTKPAHMREVICNLDTNTNVAVLFAVLRGSGGAGGVFNMQRNKFQKVTSRVKRNHLLIQLKEFIYLYACSREYSIHLFETLIRMSIRRVPASGGKKSGFSTPKNAKGSAASFNNDNGR